MEYVGIDLHKKESQICLLTETGEVIERGAVRPDAGVQRLRTVPRVRPVTAVAFVATIADAQRFHRAHEVAAYFGLVLRQQAAHQPRWLSRPSTAGDFR